MPPPDLRLAARACRWITAWSPPYGWNASEHATGTPGCATAEREESAETGGESDEVGALAEKGEEERMGRELTVAAFQNDPRVVHFSRLPRLGSLDTPFPTQ